VTNFQKSLTYGGAVAYIMYCVGHWAFDKISANMAK